jgi:uncharacterized membrane protein (DUF2068 family)
MGAGKDAPSADRRESRSGDHPETAGAPDAGDAGYAREGPPGAERYLGAKPRRSYELLVCGWRGHALVGADAARVGAQDALIAREDPGLPGLRWLRCLRCDAWLALPAPGSPAREHVQARAEIELPLRGKGLRDKLILRLIAIDRALHFLILALLAAAIFVFISHRVQLRSEFYRVIADLQGGLRQSTRTGHGFAHEIDRLVSLQAGQLDLLGFTVLGYALLEGIEAVGLWFQKRWAEYLTFIATSALLPLEVYELSARVSVLKLLTLAVNLAIVIYLIYAKRLFGVRGGAHADDAARARDQGWAALERTAPGGATLLPSGRGA